MTALPAHSMLERIVSQIPDTERARNDLRTAGAELFRLADLERLPTNAELASVRRRMWLPTESVTVPSMRSRVDRLAGMKRRLPTGFGTLDQATRGGFPPGRRLILNGAPGTCKTGFALCIGRQLALSGCHVAFHAADEEVDAILVRLGQTEQLCRDDLEDGNETALANLHAVLESHYQRLLLIDQEADGFVLDDTVDELLRRADDDKTAAVLVVDSIQTVSIRTSRPFRSKREEIDEIMRRLKTISAQGIFVIATSEMSRGAYKSRKADENVEDIASAAETRSIEYAATMLLAMRRVKDHDELVDVKMPKNRLGRKRDFRLEINFDRAMLREVAEEDQPSPENERAKEEARKLHQVEKLADELYEALLKVRAPIRSVDQLLALVRGKSDTKRQAAALLQNQGRIRKEQGTYRVVTSADAEPSKSQPHPTAPQPDPSVGGAAKTTTAPPTPRAPSEGGGDGGAVVGVGYGSRGTADSADKDEPHPTAPQPDPAPQPHPTLDGWEEDS